MKNAALLVLLFLLASCGNGKVDTSKLQEEMKAREIRVIPEATIIEKSLSLGDSLVRDLDAAKALSQSGTPIKTWGEGGEVVTATAYRFEAENDLSEKEAGVFAAYQYNAENNIKADPNAQKLPGDVIAYNAPIMLDGRLSGMWSVHLPRKFVVLTIED